MTMEEDLNKFEQFYLDENQKALQLNVHILGGYKYIKHIKEWAKRLDEIRELLGVAKVTKATYVLNADKNRKTTHFSMPLEQLLTTGNEIEVVLSKALIIVTHPIHMEAEVAIRFRKATHGNKCKIVLLGDFFKGDPYGSLF
jgi:hypothetical protein